MTRVAILDDYQQVALAMADWQALKECELVSIPDAFSSLDDAAVKLKDFDVAVLMRERTPFPRALFEKLPQLKLVVTTGAANPSVDLIAARDHGVAVCHTRGGPTGHTTAELAWGLIFAVSRKLVIEDRRVREGRWQTTIGPMLHGKTLALLGLGRLGTRMAELGKAFGMRVIAWSANLAPQRAAEKGAEYVDKDSLFAQADVLSLHLALSERTRHIVGERELALMKREAIFINTARAGLVDEAALVRALQAGTIAGAGLDVFSVEPLPASHPLTAMEQVVLSPHLGFVTEESYRIFFADVVEDIAAFLAGTPIRVLSVPA